MFTVILLRYHVTELFIVGLLWFVRICCRLTCSLIWTKCLFTISSRYNTILNLKWDRGITEMNFFSFFFAIVVAILFTSVWVMYRPIKSVWDLVYGLWLTISREIRLCILCYNEGPAGNKVFVTKAYTSARTTVIDHRM